ncbi:hypothetical protein ABBQ38_014466 [Trebouxia sp. C0009 RCD-2024]
MYWRRALVGINVHNISQAALAQQWPLSEAEDWELQIQQGILQNSAAALTLPMKLRVSLCLQWRSLFKRDIRIPWHSQQHLVGGGAASTTGAASACSSQDFFLQQI